MTLKAGLKTLGSNLSDREFEYILEKVNSSYDGKISLSEFNNIVNNETVKYENNEEKTRKLNLKLNPRYSKTFESSNLFGEESSGDNHPLTGTLIGKKDERKWTKLIKKIQENCNTLPSAFNNISKSLLLSKSTSSYPSSSQFQPQSLSLKVPDDNNRIPENRNVLKNQNDFTTDSRGRSTVHNPASCVKRSVSLNGDRIFQFGSVLGGRDSKGWGEERRGGGGGGGGGEVIQRGGRGGERIGSSRHVSRRNVAIDDRNIYYPNDSLYNDHDNYYSNNVTSNGRQYDKERRERERHQSDINSALIPVSCLRNVLSDAGVQLGTEDVKRLENRIVDKVTEDYVHSERPTFKKKQIAGEEDRGEGEGKRGLGKGMRTDGGVRGREKEEINEGLMISLDQFCDIVGISMSINPHTSKKGKKLHLLLLYLFFTYLCFSTLYLSLLYFTFFFSSFFFFLILLYFYFLSFIFLPILFPSHLFPPLIINSLLILSHLISSHIFTSHHISSLYLLSTLYSSLLISSHVFTFHHISPLLFYYFHFYFVVFFSI